MAKRLTFQGIKTEGTGVINLIVDYLKQETVGPLKSLGRFTAYGTIGSTFIAGGLVLLLTAVLRALQEETGAFHGNLSWIPYLIVSMLALAVISLAAWRIISGPAKRRLPKPEKDA